MLLPIICLLSICLFLSAPQTYSYPFCIINLCIYVLDVILIYRSNLRKNILRFETLFLVAFFFTNYVYPVFYYLVEPYFSLFQLPFDETYICKGISLSTVAVSFFSLGIKEKHKKSNHTTDSQKKLTIGRIYATPAKAMFILMLLFLPYLYGLYLTGTYTTEFESSLVNVVLQYFVYYFIFTQIANNAGKPISKILTNQPIVCVLVFIYVILFLAIGSRTIPLRIILFTVLLYGTVIQTVSKKAFLIGLALGMMMMYFVGITRSGGADNSFQLTSFLSLGEELTINNRSLYVLMEQHDLLGNNYGKTMLMNILAAVPFLQSFFLYVTGWGTGDISSASYVTDLFFGVNNSDRFGLGTNLVGDIYVSFGLLGVILFMFVGGTLLRVLYNKAKQNLLFLFIYALVFMDAIYIARSPFFTWVRAVVWCYFIYWFYNYGKQRIWEKFKLLGA